MSSKYLIVSDVLLGIRKSVILIPVPYSQALRIKRICLKTTNFEYGLQELKERLIK